MASITWWNRVEPRPRTDDLIGPLQARIRDPLWLLARQWQLGEFRAVDSGSPAWVTLTERVGAIAAWQRPDGQTVPLAAAPIEQQIAREPLTPDLATRIELGQALERLLAGAHGAAGPFRMQFPIGDAPDDPADPLEAQLRRVCAGRAVDGVAAYQAIVHHPVSVPPSPAGVLDAFVAWVESTVGPIGDTPDAPTWQPARLEYLAAVTATDAQGSTTLDVHPDDTGAIDWTAFDVRERAAGPPPPASTRSIVPAHVRFKGMPNPRFWDFEDGTIDFGDLKPDKRDLARLALVDFMLVHSNDWFMLPLDVPVGGVHSLDRLIVRDVFGVDTLIERADREPVGPGRWTMFSTSIAGSADTADFLIVAPTAGAALQFGPVVEDVRFARDEMANMVWAIENVLENAAGGAWPQRERDAARGAGAGPTMSNTTAPLVYRVESRVPEYWIPLLPVSLDPATGAVALELAAALGADGHTPILPRGRILRPTGISAATPYRLAEEEVPRNGVRVQRLTCRSRWSDGSTFLWQQRRVEHGTGETHSALRFDQALSTGAPP